ncbi:hypothetical protein M405DRAFT_825070 [Rhizopogon salebrosus TDB-379]|nr:hypothetical protein M405DRAFT_825070 [Rhizopogon salebrosus TDB-379]
MRREELVLLVTGSLSDDTLIQLTSALRPKCCCLWFTAGNIYRHQTYDCSPRADWSFDVDGHIHTLVTRAW